MRIFLSRAVFLHLKLKNRRNKKSREQKVSKSRNIFARPALRIAPRIPTQKNCVGMRGDAGESPSPWKGSQVLLAVPTQSPRIPTHTYAIPTHFYLSLQPSCNIVFILTNPVTFVSSNKKISNSRNRIADTVFSKSESLNLVLISVPKQNCRVNICPHANSDFFLSPRNILSWYPSPRKIRKSVPVPTQKSDPPWVSETGVSYWWSRIEANEMRGPHGIGVNRLTMRAIDEQA